MRNKSMTEDEAKQKWCPFSIVAEEPHGSFNRTGGDFVPKRDKNRLSIYRDAASGKEGTLAELNFGKALTRQTDYIPVGHYSPSKPAPGCGCIASACMAWTVYSEGADAPSLGYCALIRTGISPR